MSALVVVEHRSGVILPGYREAVTAARAVDTTVVALVIGENAPLLAKTLTGVDTVVAVQTPSPEHEVEREVAAVVAVARAYACTAVVAVHTATALGWAGAAAIGLGAGYAADVCALRAGVDALLAGRGLYGGRVIADVELPRGSVVLVRAAAFAADESVSEPAVEALERADVSGTRHLAYRQKDVEDVDITQAPFLLAIGRGVGEKDGIAEFEDLAELMGATLAVSRPIVDAGWIGDARQVGQSGKTVAPRVYLACGISGATQHLAGMKSAETIIAVNTDPSAAIFGVAHYGTHLDMFELAEALAAAWIS